MDTLIFNFHFQSHVTDKSKGASYTRILWNAIRVYGSYVVRNNSHHYHTPAMEVKIYNGIGLLQIYIYLERQLLFCSRIEYSIHQSVTYSFILH